MAEYFDASRQEGGIGRDAYVEGEAQSLYEQLHPEEKNADMWLAVHFPLPNLCLGVSVENNDVRHRIDDLRRCPAIVRYISYEPALGPLDLTPHLYADCDACDGAGGFCGGESGPNARPLDLVWVYSVVKQCAEAKVPVFVKQLGKTFYNSAYNYGDDKLSAGLKGADWEDINFADDLKIREFPEVRA